MSPLDIGKTAAIRPLRTVSSDTPALPAAAPASAPANGDDGVRVDVASHAADSAAPVDHERVAQIRDALRDGTYPIVPAQIADALIAARLSLRGHA